jgi:hypothetical protein
MKERNDDLPSREWRMDDPTCQHERGFMNYPYPKTTLKERLLRPADGRVITDCNIGVVRICKVCRRAV